MRLSRYFVPTLKEDPAEADVISHRLLVRAGMIRKLTSGVYSFLPLGCRALDKAARIVREEMDRSGCMEVFMPMVQPADLWMETGRWDHYGKELLRFKDRHERDSCLGPTHEEVITDIIRRDVRSYRQLPLNLYQIQTKFRDEIRPRFGLMRCREFVMKDAYSFDRDETGAQASYEQMFNAYTRIFNRLGLTFRAVEADSGAIGGSTSHEFMVLAETGEDVIAACQSCAYAANLEKAEVIPDSQASSSLPPEPEVVQTPGMNTIAKVAEFLNVQPSDIVKTLLYVADDRPVVALIPGDRELNTVKLKNHCGASEIRPADPREVADWTGAPVGYAGPVQLDMETIVADSSLRNGSDWVTGANENDAHFIHVDLTRDTRVSAYTDLVNVTESDPCPKCGGQMKFSKGIEVGHVFNLGTKYSQAMKATFLDEEGREKEMIMGCYGIGVSRIIAAAIEQNHDQNGIIFPPHIAPFEACVIALNVKDQEVMDMAEWIYQQMQGLGVDVILDDRDERPGFKFKDADLLGHPIQVIVGSKGLQNRVVEIKNRKTGERQELPLDTFEESFAGWRQELWASWGGTANPA
jgi:prolyl-tRNA synthetase